MQAISSVRLLFILSSLATCIALGFALQRQPNETAENHKGSDEIFIARVGDDLYYTPENCCGLVAAYMVTNDLGHSLALHDVARHLPVSSAGTSMHDLETFLQSYGLDTAAVEVNSEELYVILERDPHLRAIVLVWPHHWITLFSANQGKFDCYNYPRRADINESEFGRFFAKQALLVGPSRGSLDYLRRQQPSLVRVLLSFTLIGLIVCLIVMTFWIMRWRFQCSPRNRWSVNSVRER